MLRIIDAFDVPRFTYSIERKKYLPDKSLGKAGPKVYGGNSEELLFPNFDWKLVQETKTLRCWT